MAYMETNKYLRRNEKMLEYYKKHPNMSYAALGRVFKLSRERVRQILNPHSKCHETHCNQNLDALNEER